VKFIFVRRHPLEVLITFKSTGLDIILQALIILVLGSCQRGKAAGLPVSGAREASALGLCASFSRLKGNVVFCQFDFIMRIDYLRGELKK